ncbi:MAG: SRPBCC family protein, partial [Actinomycetota bacterium]|nr:SRPBCC family protein [Actinomycetota bacterium]
VKVGPITAQYKGTASWVERDETAGRAVLRASGRDTRGQGNASATITCTMAPDGDGTRVAVVTDLTITGKVAQFGRGVLADVSAKLIGQFVDALEADLRSGSGGSSPAGGAGGPDDERSAEPGAQAGGSEAQGAPSTAPGAPDEAGDSPEPAAEVGDADATGAGSARAGAGTASAAGSAGAGAGPQAEGAKSTGAAGARPGVRRVEHPEPEPVDLLDAAGGSLAKRLAPVLGGIGLVALVAVVLRRLLRR